MGTNETGETDDISEDFFLTIPWVYVTIIVWAFPKKIFCFFERVNNVAAILSKEIQSQILSTKGMR